MISPLVTTEFTIGPDNHLSGLQRPGELAGISSAVVDAAFNEAADEEVGHLMAVSAVAHLCGYDLTLHRV